MIVPAFSYLYTKREYPARGIAAWSHLNDDRGTWRRANAVAHLAHLFGISKQNARRLLHQGRGIFWRLSRTRVQVYSRKRLWRRVAQGRVDEGSVVNIPDEALKSIALMRAYFAQPALTRGPQTPCSVAHSASLLGRSKRSVTSYRQLLAETEALELIPQFEIIRPLKLSFTEPSLKPGEFINRGNVMRRVADVVIIKSAVGEGKVWNIRTPGKRQPRRYFRSGRDLARWMERRKPVARNAVVGTNVLCRVISTSVNTDPRSPRRKRSLVSGGVV